MPVPPFRRSAIPPRPARQSDADDTPATDNQPDESSAAPDQESPSFLFSGTTAKARVAASAEGNGGHSSYREFFITTKEVESAKAKGLSGYTANVHFAYNYNKEENTVCVPRVTVSEGGRWRQITAAGGGSDCAVCAALNRQPSFCPVYILVDHRTYKRQDGTKGADDVKLWVPKASMAGVFNQAVKDLSDNLGVPPESIDVTQYEAKITKIGTGRGSTWTISFISRRNPLTPQQLAGVQKVMKDGLKTTLSKWLAPLDKYTLSKGGSYIAPPKDFGRGDDGDVAF